MALSIKQWKGNTKLQHQLREVLESPALKSASETLTFAYLPTAPASLTIDGETKDLTTVLALRHMHRAGFYGFLSALQNLACPVEAQIPETPSWGALHPESE
jgi:hypothetical protein